MPFTSMRKANTSVFYEYAAALRSSMRDVVEKYGCLIDSVS